MTIVYAILAFCVMIFIHELGHFLVAKAFKMKVYEFSFGMGPRILKKQGKETLYSVKLLPFGGSVQLGEDEETGEPNSFRNKPVWQRMLVLAAGAVMNLILGVVVCAIAILVSGRVVTCTVGGFRVDDAATAQYLQAGDEIVEINGLSIWSSTDISYALQNSVVKKSNNSPFITYDFKVNRGGQIVDLDVTFSTVELEDSTESIVLDFFVLSEQPEFLNTISSAFKTACTDGRLVIMSLIDLISGTYGINDISGPVNVVKVISEAASSGATPSINISNFLSVVALITINLGVFNLLPIPALDGGRIVFLIIELFRRKPIKPEIEGMVHFVGLAALMVLMVVVTVGDITKLFT